MASVPKLVHALALIAFGVLAAAPTNAAQDDLIVASGAGNLSQVKALLAAKADVNAKQTNGVTALIAASQSGQLEVVRALLAAKADVNAKEADGVTALMIASRNNDLEVAQALLAAKADVNAKTANGGTALMIASQYSHTELVQVLLAAKADVNAKTADDVTALMIASQNGHLEVVRALLAAKADVNVKGTNDLIALMIFPPKTREFYRAMRAAVNPNFVEPGKNGGVTALMIASQRGHVEVVQALLAAKADVNAKATNGETAMSVATKGGFAQIVQLLKPSLAAETQLAPSLSSPSIRAQRYLYSGRTELAIDAFKDAIKERPDDWETLAALGAVMDATGQTLDAVPFLTRAAALAKEDWTLRLFTASVLYRAGQEARAKAEFATIARQAPNLGSRQIATDMASGHYFTDMHAAETHSWSKLGGQPPPGDLWIGRLITLGWAAPDKTVHDDGIAVPVVEAGVYLGTNVVTGGDYVGMNTPIYTIRVHSYAHNRLLVVVRGVKDNPQTRGPVGLQGLMLTFEFALAHARSAVLPATGVDARVPIQPKSQGPRSFQVTLSASARTQFQKIWRAQIDLWSGKAADAVAAVKGALNATPKDPQLHAMLGTINAQQGQFDAALAEEDAAIAAWPDYAAAHSLRGAALLNQRRYDDAIAAANRALALDPTDWNAYANLALTYRAKNDAVLAAAAEAQAAEIAPDRKISGAK